VCKLFVTVRINLLNITLYLYHADIDECAMNNGGCAPEAVCKNTVPMYACTCKPGYTGDGVYCHGKSAKAF